MPVDACALAIIVVVIIGVVILACCTVRGAARVDAGVSGKPGTAATPASVPPVAMVEDVSAPGPTPQAAGAYRPAQRPNTREENKINGSLRPLTCASGDAPPLPMPMAATRPMTATLQQCTTTIGQMC